MTRFTLAALAGVLLAGPVLPVPSWAQEAPQSKDMAPVDMVRMRQGVMLSLQTQLAPVAATARGERPLDDLTVKAATNLAALARVAHHGFAVETPGLALSKAKPAAWENRRRLDVLFGKMVTETERLSMAARERNLEGVREQHKAVDDLCAGCHAEFMAQ